MLRRRSVQRVWRRRRTRVQLGLGAGEDSAAARFSAKPQCGRRLQPANLAPPFAPPMPPSMRPLDPAVKTVWTIQLALWFGVLLLVALAYDLAHLLRDERLLPPGLVTGVVLVVGGALAVGVPRLRYRYWRFDLLPDELYLERGILNRVRTIVPLRRIQHLDVSQNVVEREFELGKLIVHTAGTRSSDVVVPGLRLGEAERLRDEVKRYLLEEDAL